MVILGGTSQKGLRKRKLENERERKNTMRVLPKKRAKEEVKIVGDREIRRNQ